MRDGGYSYRATVDVLDGVPDNYYSSVGKILNGINVGDDVYIRFARGMGIIKPRPPLDAYRPVVRPPSLREICSGREIAQLLAAMDEAGVNMDYVLEALAEKLLDDANSGPVTYTPYSVYGFEMEGI